MDEGRRVISRSVGAGRGWGETLGQWPRPPETTPPALPRPAARRRRGSPDVRGACGGPAAPERRRELRRVPQLSALVPGRPLLLHRREGLAWRGPRLLQSWAHAEAGTRPGSAPGRERVAWWPPVPGRPSRLPRRLPALPPGPPASSD